MSRALRAAALGALVLVACKKSSGPPPSPALRFLPASPDLVLRLDMKRIRAWALYDKAAPIALAGAAKLLEDAKQRCNLDVIGDATSIVIARRGALLAGDLTLVVAGLDRAKVTSCLQAIATQASVLSITLDGDVVQASIADRPVASGAFLPGGEIVLVSRDGAGVAPDAWKAEVTQGATTIPAYWAELDAKQPIAIRVVDDVRTVLASVELGDPLIVRGKVVTASEAAARDDAKRMNAILGYLSQADTGTGRIEPQGATIFADFTATGPQAANFVGVALPAVMGAGGPARDLTLDVKTGPGDCSVLPAAVEKYLATGMQKAPPERRQEMEKALPTLGPALQQAFVDTCTADQWSASSVECHVTNADALAQFERCRETLTEEQRGHLDTALATAISASAPAP